MESTYTSPGDVTITTGVPPPVPNSAPAGPTGKDPDVTVSTSVEPARRVSSPGVGVASIEGGLLTVRVWRDTASRTVHSATGLMATV